MSDREKKSAKRGSTSNPAHETITFKLREYYDAVKEEAIPDHFLDLLERLDAADAAYNAKDSSNGNSSGEHSA